MFSSILCWIVHVLCYKSTLCMLIIPDFALEIQFIISKILVISNSLLSYVLPKIHSWKLKKIIHRVSSICRNSQKVCSCNCIYRYMQHMHTTVVNIYCSCTNICTFHLVSRNVCLVPNCYPGSTLCRKYMKQLIL